MTKLVNRNYKTKVLTHKLSTLISLSTTILLILTYFFEDGAQVGGHYEQPVQGKLQCHFVRQFWVQRGSFKFSHSSPSGSTGSQKLGVAVGVL